MKLFKSFHKNNKNIAVVDENNFQLTYAQILEEINKIKKKVKQRSLILILSDNSIGFLISYIFCILKNHVAIILDPKTSEKNKLKIFKSFQPNFVFLNKENINIFKKVCKTKYFFFNQCLMANNERIKNKINNDLCLLLPTSGSMSSVKFVKLSKTNIKFNTESIIKYLKINKKDISITNLPAGYSYMLSIINSHFQAGGSIIISKYSVVEKKFWQIIEKNKITSFNGVPYTYEIINRIGLDKLKIKSLKYFTQAGGKIEKKLLIKIINFCKKNKIKFFSMYGQTEASPRISYLDPKYSKKKLGSVGKAIPGNNIYLTDESDKKITKPYSVGEIICKGKNIFMGYSKNYKDLNKKNEQNFKLKTGDLGYFDCEGFLYITGRKNKIVKIFGNRIDIEVLENQMNDKGYNIKCLSDDKKIFIFVEKKYKKKTLIETISKISNLHKDSFELVKLKYFPRTSNNKISYNELNKKYVKL